jgi:hypothetical protein
MDEEEWLACSDSRRMVAFLRGKTSDRKFLLFAVACWRRVWEGIVPDRNRQAITILEAIADGLAMEQDLLATLLPHAMNFQTVDGHYNLAEAFVLGPETSNEDERGIRIISDTACTAFTAASGTGLVFPLVEQAHLVRELFGNPFRPVSIDPAWRTPTVTALATPTYDNRILPTGALDADRLAILADAL